MLDNSQVTVACLPEITLGSTCPRNDKVSDKDSHYGLFHSGPKAPDQQKVAIALGHHVSSVLLSWEPISHWHTGISKVNSPNLLWLSSTPQIFHS